MNYEQSPHDNSTAPSKRKPAEIIEEMSDAVKTHGIPMIVIIALFVVPILCGVAWYHMVAFVVIYVVIFMAIRNHGGNGWDD